MRRGLISGSFDLLHAGHISLLQKASTYCDNLICAVSSDALIRHRKGSGRPICPEAHRVAMLRALSVIDTVVVIDGVTDDEVTASLAKFVETFNIDVVFCGTGRTADKYFLPIQNQFGFDYVIIDSECGESTSGIVERIRTYFCGERV